VIYIYILVEYHLKAYMYKCSINRPELSRDIFCKKKNVGMTLRDARGWSLMEYILT